MKFFTQVGPLKAIGAFGLAVIVLTIGIRAVLFPIFGWQLRTSRRIQAEQRLVAPQLQELRKKYKKEPQRLSQEMNALYKEHGISPFSSLTGCIPALVQMPVLIGLYQSIRTVTATLGAGDKGFLWIPDLTKSAQAACCTGSTGLAGLLTHPALLILPLLAGAFTFAQSRMMMPPDAPGHDRPGTLDAGRDQADVVHLPGHDLRVQLPVPAGAGHLLGHRDDVHGGAAVPPARVERSRGSHRGSRAPNGSPR